MYTDGYVEFQIPVRTSFVIIRPVLNTKVILPTAQDLAAVRDPVLSRAAAIAGVKLDPSNAGKLFPFEWRPM